MQTIVDNGMVSVIILSYKNLDGIMDTLNSVLVQNYQSIEIIFSDDGTPGYEEYAKTFLAHIEKTGQDNIKNVIVNSLKENQGTVKNINSALEQATGQYVKLISSEDKLTAEDSLEKYVRFFRENDFDICFSKTRGVTDEGEYIYEMLSCESDYDKLKSFSVEEMRNYLFRRNCLPAPGAFMKRKLFHEHGLFLNITRLIEDYPYWIHLTLEGVTFGYIDEVLVDYRQSGVSSAGSYSLMFMNDLLAIYDNYIFPYDKRFGIFQGFYNFLKRQGLQFYINKAKWQELTGLQKFGSYVKYGVFYVYTWGQKKMIAWKNRK